MLSSAFVDKNGKMVTLWVKNIGGVTVVQVDNTTGAFPGTWSVPVSLSNPLVNANLPSMGNNSIGDIVISWVEPVSPGVSNQFVSIKPIATGVWSAPVRLVNTGNVKSATKISVNDNGQILAQWTAYTDTSLVSSAIYVSTSTVASGVWSVPQNLSS